MKNKFTKGDSLELMTPQGNMNFTLEHLENGKGEAIEVAPGDGHPVWISVPEGVDLAYALLLRNFTDGNSTYDPHGKNRTK